MEKLLAVEHDSVKGRQFMAKASLNENQKVLECRPYAAVICFAWAKDRQVCWHCFRLNEKSRWKIKCKHSDRKSAGNSAVCWAVYCSEQCRDRDALLNHSQECCWQLIQLNKESTNRCKLKESWCSTFDDDQHDDAPFDWESPVNNFNNWLPTTDDCEIMQLVIMALCRRFNQHQLLSDKIELIDNEPTWLEFEDIQNNEPFISRGKKLSFKCCYQLLRSIKCPFLGHDASLFRSVVFREIANSFGIWDSDEITDSSELLGYGVFPRAVFFNHSCSPDIIKKQSGRSLMFFTNRPVDTGEPLCISYGDVTSPVDQRQNRLHQNYFFHCDCLRCRSDMESENFIR